MSQLRNLPKAITAFIPVLIVASLASCKKETTVSPVIDMRLLPNESRPIDLDGNGLVDFTFAYIGYQTHDYPPSAASWMLNVRPHNGNQVQYKHPEGTIPLQDSTLIDGSIGWTEYGTTLASVSWRSSTGWASSWSGIWIGVGERSLGVRLRKEGLYYYGWVKLSIGSRTGLLTISDSAYQSLPNTGILAGIHP